MIYPSKNHPDPRDVHSKLACRSAAKPPMPPKPPSSSSSPRAQGATALVLGAPELHR